MGMGHGHLLTEEKEEDNEEWEQSLQDGGNYTKTLLDKLKKERENVKRSRRTEEEKTNPSVEVLEACCPCLQEACHGQLQCGFSD
jgi:hypothetical protein